MRWNLTPFHKPQGSVRSTLAVLGVAVGTCLVAVLPGVAPAAATAADQKVEVAILGQPEDRQLVFWVTFRARADLAVAPKVADFGDRGQLVVDRLQGSADTSQAAIADLLTSRGIDHESFWVSNTMRVTGLKRLALELAERPEVDKVVADRTYALPDPAPATDSGPNSVEWNIAAVRAPEVWAGLGASGEGVVVANLDTGVQFDHPALVNHYRGNRGGSFDHNYNWYDPAGVCGSPSVTPCDNYGHGTHTMGTMVGDDGAGGNRIGVAPGAKWIAAKGCEYNSCSTSSLLAAGQWLLAPTDLNGQNPRPDLRPNIVNNSWGGPPQDLFFQAIVTSWVASGIFPVFSNGNSGPGCGSAASPADYAASYAVGAYDSSGAIAAFSSRGSTMSGAMKPDIAAPGVSVRSSVPGNGYATYSGTSMAAPHVAATVALMWSAAPVLRSDVAATRALLAETAIDTSDLSCGGTASDNGVWGKGRLDAYAAVEVSPRGPTGTLTGVVRDAATGQPLVGAEIRSARAGQSPRLTVTDAAGEYRQRLDTGRYQVGVNLFGFAAGLADVDLRENETTLSDVLLTPTARFGVSGTVRDGTGAPVEGARVSIAGTPLPAQSTDAGGAFRFPPVPGGDYQILVAASGCLNGGSRALRVDAQVVADVAVVRRSDAFGYSCRSVSPAYIEADTVVALAGDDNVTSVPLPFPFSYYGASYTTAGVSTNGVIGLAGGSGSYVNSPVPDGALPNAAIYPFWDDLYVDTASSVRTADVGSEPDRRFVIEWRNVRFYGPTNLWFDFEAILDQAGGIVFQYRRIADDPLARGAWATIGIEDSTGATGLGYSYNQPVLTPPATAIRFDHPSGATNSPPDAVADVVTRSSPGAATVSVLANDHEADGDSLRVTGVSDPPRGTAVVNPDGTVTWTPDLGYVGSDAFTYDLADGRGGTDRATVAVGLDGERPPIAVDDLATTREEGPVTVAPLANDSDPDGDPLQMTLAFPAHGSVIRNPDDTVTYTPGWDFNGTDSFTYEVADGRGGVASARVSVTVTPVNDVPTPLLDVVNVVQDTTNTIAVLANDTDVDGDVLRITAVTHPLRGTAAANADGTVTYRSDAGFTGTDTFRYDVTDGHGGAAQAEVYVIVDKAKLSQVPLSVWTYPGSPSLDGLGNWVVPVNEPTAGAGQMSPAYVYSHAFWFLDTRASGTVALSTGPGGKVASLTITRANGTTSQAAIPYTWAAGRAYFLLVHHLGGGRWGAWVVDGTTGVSTGIGALTVSPQNQNLYPTSVTYVAWIGAGTASCGAYPVSQALVFPSSGFSAGQVRTSASRAVANAAADCPATTVNGPGWVYYALGTGF